MVENITAKNDSGRESSIDVQPVIAPFPISCAFLRFGCCLSGESIGNRGCSSRAIPGRARTMRLSPQPVPQTRGVDGSQRAAATVLSYWSMAANWNEQHGKPMPTPQSLTQSGKVRSFLSCFFTSHGPDHEGSGEMY